jgi:hypothetical protein
MQRLMTELKQKADAFESENAKLKAEAQMEKAGRDLAEREVAVLKANAEAKAMAEAEVAALSAAEERRQPGKTLVDMMTSPIKFTVGDLFERTQSSKQEAMPCDDLLAKIGLRSLYEVSLPSGAKQPVLEGKELGSGGQANVFETLFLEEPPYHQIVRKQRSASPPHTAVPVAHNALSPACRHPCVHQLEGIYDVLRRAHATAFAAHKPWLPPHHA